ncbi:M23 family metallopeptidase [Ulvibacter antarcticus]|uniref:Peptidase M23-like protein n=1 Tax=Ulvibacter antarcticus TaxID=442714 RepID=A0A3L9Z301_9FLAO|nr:M23 family metallopeptidase [Ulvibacter antarcticus]RMA64675.1 peptidase M23-like protein [Ulvibacter antarcticus]
MKLLVLINFVLLLFINCEKKSSATAIYNPGQGGAGNATIGCTNYDYGNWETSYYVLPYPVDISYTVNLSHCTSSYHAEGRPDQFGIDFDMPIGSLITATREGTVIHIEESGIDGGFPNNLVVVQQNDNTYAQYMHLTENGAIVSVGDVVEKGSHIGYSGSTGLAGYPHLHFIVTIESWEYPYVGIPYNFKNTEANPHSLQLGKSYTALPY